MSLHDIHRMAVTVRAHGRGDDSELVHLTPDEVDALAELQGGYVINPDTGLPEFGLLGKILKGVVRAGGAVLGGMFGGPAGAAAGAGLATKLTGGSWKQALTTGALSGVGGLLASGLGGGGWGLTTPMGGANAVGTNIAGQIGPIAGAYGAAAPSFGAGLASAAMSAPGIASGLNAGLSAMTPNAGGGNQGPPDWWNQAPAGPSRIEPIAPGTPWGTGAPQREFVPYTGDWATYGERGGHNWWRPIPQAQPQTSAPVTGLDAASEMSYLPPPGTNASVEQRHLNPMMPEYYLPDMYPHYEFARGGGTRKRGRSRLGMSLAAKMGTVKGPGSGTDDAIPAMLSDGEHVLDAEVVNMIGDGSSDEGHRRIEKMKRDVRAKKRNAPARRPAPKRGGLESVMKIIPKAA